MDIAYLVACEKYKYGINALNGPSNDIGVMYKVLVNYCGISGKNITCFCDTEMFGNDGEILQPGRDNILCKLYEDSKMKREESIDNLFFYYSGHGYINSNYNFCIIPTNSNAAYLDCFSITDKQLAEQLMDFKAKNIIFIFDACQTDCKEKGIREIKKLPNSIVTFYSCTMGSKSYILPNANISAFTLCLSQALCEEGKCRTVGDVSDYLDTHLRQLCLENNIYDIQTSQTKVEDISLRNIVLAKKYCENVYNLSSDEVKMVNDFAQQLDFNYIQMLLQYGEGLCTKIKKDMDLIIDLENNHASKELMLWFSDFFVEFSRYSKKKVLYLG